MSYFACDHGSLSSLRIFMEEYNCMHCTLVVLPFA